MSSICLSCSKPTKYQPPKYTGKFCSNDCQQDYRWEYETKPKLLEGKVNINSSAIRRFLTERDGYHCTRCGINSWQGEDIALDVDHVDGDRSNNKPENLRYLCPNCHRLTPTWGNKTRG